MSCLSNLIISYSCIVKLVACRLWLGPWPRLTPESPLVAWSKEFMKPIVYRSFYLTPILYSASLSLTPGSIVKHGARLLLIRNARSGLKGVIVYSLVLAGFNRRALHSALSEDIRLYSVRP